MYVIVLCGNPQEGNRYAKRAKLPVGRYRVATRAGSIKGLRVAEVHELPSFASRPDKHAIEAVLRYAKCERLQVEMPEEDLRVTAEQALAEIEGELEDLAAMIFDDIIDRPDSVAGPIIEAFLDSDIANLTSWHRQAVIQGVHDAGREELLLDEEDRGEETGTPEPSEAPAPAPKPKRPAKKAAPKPKPVVNVSPNKPTPASGEAFFQ